ncbi:glycosyl hydrolase family 8 [Fibrobacter succinogenes]|uniref:glycosyl hydrolase family 8 n=1 Tax=Fibrobacter succinogenes TaxID=833 RepID=UPI0013D6D943|nr:glycosyl hydrolase family 8 [Fibrobacter succinogenes]
MLFKKILAPMVAPLTLGAVIGLTACGDDSSNSNNANPVNPDPVINPDPSTTPTDPSTTPSTTPTDPTTTPTDPSTTPSTTPTDPTTTPTPTTAWVSPVPLASIANINYSTVLYQTWKPFHFVNMEDEALYYPELASEFDVVFPATYQPAGRVLWSAQTTGYYKNRCNDDDTTIPSLRYRACTVSEGVGYGMLLTMANGDTDAFVRLWNYSRAFREYNSTSTAKRYLTPWITYSFHFSEIDLSSATDADLDIATSLILMYYKTGQQAFLDDAKNIVNALWDAEVNKTSLLLYSGDTDVWNGGNGKEPVYNLSYFSPVALRLFAMVDPNHNWTGVLDAMYTYISKVQAAGTGVLPDWSNEAGVAANPDNGSADKTYWTFNKESVRIPWRIAWDYYWFQDPRALTVLTTLNNFISAKAGGDPNSKALAVQYSWDPAKNDATGNSAVPTQWLAAWCATGIGTNQAWLESCTGLVNGKSVTNNNSSYFTDILLGLYSSLLNGAFVKPFN